MFQPVTLLKAQTAKAFWNENAFDNKDIVIVLPHADKYFNQMLIDRADKTNKSFVVVTPCAVEQDKTNCIVIISQEMTDALLALYSMYEFTDKLVVGSFDLPPGRKLKNLLDCGIADEEKLIDDVILRALNE